MKYKILLPLLVSTLLLAAYTYAHNQPQPTPKNQEKPQVTIPKPESGKPKAESGKPKAESGKPASKDSDNFSQWFWEYHEDNSFNMTRLNRFSKPYATAYLRLAQE